MCAALYGIPKKTPGLGSFSRFRFAIGNIFMPTDLCPVAEQLNKLTCRRAHTKIRTKERNNTQTSINFQLKFIFNGRTQNLSSCIPTAHTLHRNKMEEIKEHVPPGQYLRNGRG